MNFCDIYKEIDYNSIPNEIYKKNDSDVLTALEKDLLTHDDFIALISPAAEKHIEAMAVRAHQITMRRFGNTMGLYAPLYVSNECTNRCVYCGFNRDNRIKRVTLSIDDALKEADIIYDSGIRDILLVSGEAPHIVSTDYLKDLISKLAKKFSSIAVEIYPMSADGYSELVQSGCDGLTIYQETYDEALYEKLHRGGKKRDFMFRLETPDRGGSAKIRRLGIGILMGLCDWRVDGAMLGAHAEYLIKKYWTSKVSVSFPRLRPALGGFRPLYPISDKNLVQIVTAFRIFKHDIGLVISTRERPELRDNMLPLGITQMSAGSKTNPGGYSIDLDSSEQFEVIDKRTTSEVSEMLQKAGYDPVFKDWGA